MKSVTFLSSILASLLLMGSCSLFNSKKNDLEKSGLKGDVKVLTEYDAIVQSGELVKGNMVSRSLYDEDGFLTCVELFDEGTLFEKHLFTYDKDHRKTLSEVLDAENEKQRDLIFHYDELGNMVYCEDFNRKGCLMYRAENTFDSFGNLVENKISSSDGTFVSKTVMAYDQFGNDTLFCVYDEPDKVSRKEFRYYDKDGNMVEQVVYNSYDMFVSQDIYKYDGQGNLTENYTYALNNVLQGKISVSYDFDGEGNYLTSRVFDKDSVLVDGSFRTIEYY